jgi:methionyl-tRNA synthetase
MKAINPGYCPVCGYFVDSHGYGEWRGNDSEAMRDAHCDRCGCDYVDTYRIDRQSSMGEVLAVAAPSTTPTNEVAP